MGTTAQKLQAILNSKAAIKTAINNKGGSITDSTPLDEYATAIGNIPTPTLQSKTANPSTSQQTITPDVGYNGLSQVTINPVTASIDANIQAGNIKKDVTILGVTGTFEGGGGSSDLDKLIDGTITSVTSSATNIKQYAFYNCYNLTSASFPNVTLISGNAFQGCSYLANFNAPNIITLGDNVFRSCINLTSASFSNATSIGNYTYYGCSGLTSASFHSVTTIGNYAFYNCTSLTSASFPNVTIIGNNSFMNCTSLTSANFDKLAQLAQHCFQGCTSLTSIILPKAETIPNYSFMDCSSLTSITLSGNWVVVLVNTQALPASSLHHMTIYVPSNQISNYQTATNWSTLYNNGDVTFVAIS